MDQAVAQSDDAISIRPWRPADAPEVFAAVEESRAQIAPWLPDLGASHSAETIAAWIASCPADWQRGEKGCCAVGSPLATQPTTR
ncbi:MAG TPA: hypothetical protein VFX76_07540 [Roseiflexaceae bacterium]|nr:hypothetical protein [Roseiflexaceae bacterium]